MNLESELGRFYTSLTSILKEVSPSDDMPTPFEDDAILERAKALDAISDRLGFAATVLNLGQIRSGWTDLEASPQK
jgi:hypothetical protein